MEMTMERTRPFATFMAFGTKGDVYPIAAVAAAFACDQQKYEVSFITHSAHHDLAAHLAERNVRYHPVSSPPVVSPPGDDESDSSVTNSFSIQKTMVALGHRQECLSVVEKIYGDCPSKEDDFILINLFALEGWSLAELFHVQCIVAAPYVVPYTAPSTFERQFRRELPLLHKYLQEAPVGKLGWKDVTHWMWPLFSEKWALWRRDVLNISPVPFTDPVTDLPIWHDRPSSPLLLYGFSREVVESPDYWPSNSRVCGFWYLPSNWQFSCKGCQNIFDSERKLCITHTGLQSFLNTSTSMPLVFVGLSSAGSMGFLRNPTALLQILRNVLEITKCRFMLFTAGFEPLDVAIEVLAAEEDSLSLNKENGLDSGVSLFNGRMFCFPHSVPYSWLFQKCAVAIHHGGSGSTAAALKAAIPQVICPFMLDQFYWAERMCWLGVAPAPLKRSHLLPKYCDAVSIREGSYMVSEAISCALNPEVKARALEISEKILQEDGVSEAVRILKEEIS